MSSDLPPSSTPSTGSQSPEPPSKVIGRLKRLRSGIAAVLGLPRSCLNAARAAYRADRERAVRAQLAVTPLRELRRFSEGRISYGAIEAAGIRTVGAAMATGASRLESIRGVGSTSSSRIRTAAKRLENEARRGLKVRFDIGSQPREQTNLLNALRALDEARRSIRPITPRLEAAKRRIDADFADARVAASRFRRVFARPRRKERSRAALERMVEFLNEPETAALESEIADIRSRLEKPRSGWTGIWDEYAAQAATYNGLLAEIEELELGPDRQVGQQGSQRSDHQGGRQRSHQGNRQAGHQRGRQRGRQLKIEARNVGPTRPDRLGDRQLLPADIAERITSFDLDVTLLGASLRGYQDFGAKFALVQKRVILGDEMGLGKTIEALAVLCHLRSRGATHFLVVCPASVLANWENEIRRHSQLPTPLRLHGHLRERLLRKWTREGGVAITTFDTLRLLHMPTTDIAAVVVDEAHYVKNPGARRTGAVLACLERSEHALLMSGTPLENRLEEFRTLVNHVQPAIATRLITVGGPNSADAFQRAAAPVYLRRNQTDVLDELPKKIETANWLPLEGAAADRYRRAVASGNFMEMRRAVFLTDNPADSPKLTRLREIVEEATDNDRKVIVYSYFRDVLNRVYEALGPLAMGPLTGSVSGPRRQELVDEFSTRREPAVLVSQIEAGGIGLNIQAASVVIIAEPQWKPSTEEQAIARSHRMGQIRPVEVHRLLTENSVDEHMLAILARKSALFASYIRPSAMKDATAAAVDTSTATSSQSTQEEQIIESERRRLGLAA
ncbi:MAG: DEAD/DEAH box helicase [bacterium]|nr:DEAD/DEAH box helicase [bacterium]